VRQLECGAAPAPRRLSPPITVAVEFIRSEMADAAAILPGAERIGGKRVAFTATDMPTAYRAFRSLVGLANV
jgi:D-amino peptidase